jgi:hypothetical protein
MARQAIKDAAIAHATKLRLVGTIGGMVDELHELRERKRALEAQVSEIETKYSEIEQQLLAKLEAENSDKGSGKKASVSVTSTIVATVTDWDALYAYIQKHKYWHLLQRRPSDPAFRELWEQGKKVPGAESFSRKKLNLRSN